MAVMLGALGACGTPCDAPGRLCAPIGANTSAVPPARSAAAPAAISTAAAEVRVPAQVSTFPIAQPDIGNAAAANAGSAVQAGQAGQDGSKAAPGAAEAEPGAEPASAAPGEEQPLRIALLLPLHPNPLKAAAAAVKSGFFAAYERERGTIAVNVIDTGDTAQSVLDAYARAAEQNDIIVGPLARADVATVAASPALVKPTIALNRPQRQGEDGEPELPQAMLMIGLSMEDEARQVADWAASRHPNGRVLILSSGAAWQQRVAHAFAAQWQARGLDANTLELQSSDGFLSDEGLAALKSRLGGELPDLLFAALDASQLRQVRAEIGDGLPVYGTSSINPGTASLAELDGIQVVDLPWETQLDHPAVMAYPRPAAPMSVDLERLYALGIDAFRVARALARQPAGAFQLDGVTGQLRIRYGDGPASFARTENAAVYRAGSFAPVAAAR